MELSRQWKKAAVCLLKGTSVGDETVLANLSALADVRSRPCSSHTCVLPRLPCLLASPASAQSMAWHTQALSFLLLKPRGAPCPKQMLGGILGADRRVTDSGKTEAFSVLGWRV